MKNALRQMIFKLAATPQGMQMFSHYVKWIDMPISRFTKGRLIPSAQGGMMPVHYLTTTGAKSGIRRSVPVLCVPDGENLILVGSNWGKAQNPGWVYNLRAHPNAYIVKGKMQKDVVARELHADERTTYWQKATAFYPPYRRYEQAAGRMLPIFLLEGQNQKDHPDG